MKNTFTAFLLSACTLTLCAQQNLRRPLQPSDFYRTKEISDIQFSPEGNWVAYTLTTPDSVKNKMHSAIWMTNWDGAQTIQLTNSDEGENTARWSPDGRFLSFLSTRHSTEEDAQLWLLDRRGGEAQKKTEVKGEIEEYTWSPDGKKILFVIRDADYSDTAKNKVRAPYVINRFHFKEDIKGYLDNRHSHLYLFDPASRKMDTLTKGNFNESSPCWSPDGKSIVFVSNHTQDADRNENDDLWLLTLNASENPKQLTFWKGSDSKPLWSPDGKYIAYLRSSSEENFLMYGQSELAILEQGKEPVILSQKTDRPISGLQWNADSKSVYGIVADDRQNYLAAFAVQGEIKKISPADKSCTEISISKNGKWTGLFSDSQTPGEVYAQEADTLRRLSHQQDSFLAPLTLAKVNGFRSRSKDGTLIGGLLYLPQNDSGKKLPLILYIHGGPVGQDGFEFDLYRQMLAAGGYAVAAVNYRGSNGRGVAFTRSIFGDWGHKEVMDILGAADYLVKEGIVDPEKIAIGGWSYGGILTDYCIATDTRFKAASSGAGSALQLTMYGIDQYTNQYENELGAPWKNINKWLSLSYPFLQVEKIKTPTLFMASQSDFNVPVAGAEQMYQALRSTGVATELVIYPKQFHEITVPGYLADRFTRYLNWFGKYLK